MIGARPNDIDTYTTHLKAGGDEGALGGTDTYARLLQFFRLPLYRCQSSPMLE